eukprot:8438735-Pyramimonas_sp.AAC.1
MVNPIDDQPHESGPSGSRPATAADPSVLHKRQKQFRRVEFAAPSERLREAEEVLGMWVEQFVKAVFDVPAEVERKRRKREAKARADKDRTAAAAERTAAERTAEGAAAEMGTVEGATAMAVDVAEPTSGTTGGTTGGTSAAAMATSPAGSREDLVASTEAAEAQAEAMCEGDGEEEVAAGLVRKHSRRAAHVLGELGADALLEIYVQGELMPG